MSGFPIKKTLDDFDFSFQPSIDKRQIDELDTIRFLENGENVVFLGLSSVGKPHLASALGLVAAQHRFSTYYINCHQLIEQLKKARFENRLPDKLKAPTGYIHDETPKNIAVRTGVASTLIFDSAPTTTLVIRKYIEGTENKPLSGVAFKVTDGSGAAVGPDDGVYYTDKCRITDAVFQRQTLYSVIGIQPKAIFSAFRF